MSRKRTSLLAAAVILCIPLSAATSLPAFAAPSSPPRAAAMPARPVGGHRVGSAKTVPGAAYHPPTQPLRLPSGSRHVLPKRPRPHVVVKASDLLPKPGGKGQFEASRAGAKPMAVRGTAGSAASPSTAPAGTITTVAGNGLAPGAATSLGQSPASVVSFGSLLYISDDRFQVVRKVDAGTGMETVVAGNGVAGYAGDGGAATAANLHTPFGLAVDSAGNLYIADAGNNVIRKVAVSTGVITTVAGTGLSGYSGDGGSATGSTLNTPDGVAVDEDGNIFIADTANRVVREVSSGMISTVAGDGACTAPHGLVGSGGSATAAELCSPTSVAVEPNGVVLVGDMGNSVVDSLSGGRLTIFAGNGTAGETGDGGAPTAAELDTPNGLAVDGSGNVYIADTNQSAVREVTNGVIKALAGPHDAFHDDPYAYGPYQGANGYSPNGPTGVSVDSSGNVYVADANSLRVDDLTKRDPYGSATVVAGDGTPNAGISGDGEPGPSGEVAVTALSENGTGTLYFNDDMANWLPGTTRTLSLAGTLGTAAPEPSGSTGRYLAVGPDGTQYYQGYYAVWKISPTGVYTDIGCDLSGESPLGIVVAGDGTAYVANPEVGVCAIKPDGSIDNTFPKSEPVAMALDANGDLWYLGPNDTVTALDLHEMTRNGTVRTVATNLPGPAVPDGWNSLDRAGISLVMDSAGNAFFTDGDHYVHERHADGSLNIVAGTGAAPANDTPAGDNGPATAASTNATALALDTAGNLYLADEGTIRQVAGASTAGGAFPAHGPAIQAQAPPVDLPVAYPSAGLGPTEAPGPANPAESCGCAQGAAGDPVDTASGNFWHTFTDLATPGHGLGLSVSRTYLSLDAAQDGLFGYGWTSPYGMSLSADSAGTITVTQEDGSQIAFTPNNGAYVPAQPRILATLTQNSDGSFRLVRRHRQIFTFSAAGQLTAISDLNGATTSLSYDTTGNLNSVTDSSGRSYAITTTNGRITQVTDPAGRTVTYAYDTTGNLISATDPTGATWTYTYDSAHQLLTMLDPNQQGASSPTPLTNVYDSTGRVTSQTDFAGRTTSFDYTSISGATKITDPIGRVSIDYYSNGLRTKQTTAYGTSMAASTSYTYDATTLALASVTDPLNHTTSFTYDGDGNTLTSTDALNRTTTNTYDSLNDLLTTTDPSGVTTTHTYDSRGNLLSTSTPLLSSTGAVTATRATSYTYDSAGDLLTSTDPNGNTTTNTYDTYGDLTSTTLPPTAENKTGDKTTYAYDANTGRHLTTTSPRGNLPGATAANYTTSYGYDNDGRQLYVRDSMWNSSKPAAHQQAQSYDADGNLVTSTDGDNQTYTYAYDGDGNQITITRPNGSIIRQTFNGDGQQLTYRDTLGETTSYTYDATGHVTTATTQLGKTTTYTYDLAGRLILTAAPGATCSGTSPTAGCTTDTYDAANEVTAQTYLDGSGPDITNISYDQDGRRTGDTDPTGTSTTTYDSLGRLTTSTDGNGTTTSYGYDLASNLTSLSYPGGHAISQRWDAADRLTGVTDWLSNTTTYAYDADSNQTVTTYPSGTGEKDTTSFNQLDHLTAINDIQTSGGATTTLAGFTYTHENAGMILQTTTTGSLTEPNQNYSYTGQDHLAHSGPSTTPTTYTYDGADRITNRGTTSGAAASTLAYNHDGQLCWSTTTTVASPSCGTVPGGATTYSFDTRGNRTSSSTGASTTGYGYNEANQLTSYSPAGGTATTYTYDEDGLRQSTTTGTAITHYTWNHAGNLPLLLSDDTNDYIYGVDGQPLEQIATASGAVTWLHHDQLGNTRLLTNNTGTVTGTATYDPYGTLTTSTGTLSPLGYQGQYTDTETGLIYLRARYYDPATAQFITVDPALAFTREAYAYAADNPINAIDPTGLCVAGFGLVCSAAGAAGHAIAHGATWVAENPGIALGAAAAVAGVVGLSALTLGGADVILLGGVALAGADAAGGITVGAAADFAATTLGVAAADVDCAKEGLGRTCAFDLASAGFGALGALADFGYASATVGAALDFSSVGVGVTGLALGSTDGEDEKSARC